MKKSIRIKMTIILVSILSGVLLSTLLLNVFFAEEYYLAEEKQTITESFEKVKKYLTEGDENYIEDLEQLSNQTNVKMMVADNRSTLFSQTVIFSNMSDGTRVYKQILNYLNAIRSEISSENSSDAKGNQKGLSVADMGEDIKNLVAKGYLVTQIRDTSSGQNGLYLFGFIENDYIVAMRVSIDGIRSSVKISCRFMAYMSIIAIMVGICIAGWYSYHFTKPIKEMANVANRMSNLDFESKVENLSDDELGDLGESINQLSSALESTIADLKSANLELQQDIKEKEEIDDMRKEFISHVSHELKTPIAIIQGYAEGLKDGIAEDQESMDFYCEVIADEAQKMNQMVRKLLTLNQFEFGNDPLNIIRFDLKQLIENKLSSSQILFNKKAVKVQFDENESAYVWADEFMIEEVFNNYLTNALNHVVDGGNIHIWFERNGKTIRTNVFNEGKLIPNEELEKLWIKFYKVDKARTREYGGNGIGLSIVAAAMRAHNKDFGVRNTENGVVFYFDLDAEN